MYKAVLLALGCLVVVACGGGDAGGTYTSTPRPLAIDSVGGTVVLGDRQTVTLTVTFASGAESHQVTLTAFGHTVRLTEADLTHDSLYTKNLGDWQTLSLQSLGGSWDQAHNRTLGYDYVVPYMAYISSDRIMDDGTLAQFIYDVYGDATAPSDMPPVAARHIGGRPMG